MNTTAHLYALLAIALAAAWSAPLYLMLKAGETKHEPQVEPIELPAMLNGQAVRLFLDGSEAQTVAYDVGAHWAIINTDTMSAVLVPKQ
jgi:hypothetical protein